MEGQAKPAETHGNGKGKQNTPYGGYYQSEVPAYDAELTETDAGTPMGEFMRRFWHPVCLSEEITDLVHPIRILGEDLVAFRDKSGRIGVLHRHCSHRGTSLEFGLVQERGVRCCYHAWHFDIDGTILDTPGEPANSRIKENVCQGAYPAFERHGLVFAYMGPPEEMPEFPLYETSLAPDTDIYPYSNYFSCNWLQLHENVADQAHVIFFHNGIGSRKLVEGMEAAAADTAFPPAWGGRPALDYRVTEGGRSMIYAFTRRIGDRIWIRNNQFILPNYIEFGNVFEDLSTSCLSALRAYTHSDQLRVDLMRRKMVRSVKASWSYTGVRSHIQPDMARFQLRNISLELVSSAGTCHTTTLTRPTSACAISTMRSIPTIWAMCPSSVLREAISSVVRTATGPVRNGTVIQGTGTSS